MVLRERLDFRMYEKSYSSDPFCGESAEERLCRVCPEQGRKKGFVPPLTVFIRRKDGVIKELPRFYDDMLFTYDGARIERVFAGFPWERVKHDVRVFAFEGINRALHDDAKKLSLLAGEGPEDGQEDFFKDDGLMDMMSDEHEVGWLDALSSRVRRSSCFERICANLCQGFYSG